MLKDIQPLQPSDITGSILSPIGATAAQEIALGELPINICRAEVRRSVSQLFQNLDGRVAEMIGFDGSIIETVNAWHEANEGALHLSDLQSPLNRFQSGDSFFLRFDTGHSKINYVISGGTNPEVEISEPGDQFLFHVSKTYEGLLYDRVMIERTRDRNTSSMHRRRLDTFDTAIEKGKAIVVPLRVFDETDKIEVSYSYADPDSAGNVSLRDQQFISVETVNAIYNGWYQASTHTVDWQDARVPRNNMRIPQRPSFDFDQDTNAITVTDHPDFGGRSAGVICIPVRVNMYDTLREICQDLPGATPSQFLSLKR